MSHKYFLHTLEPNEILFVGQISYSFFRVKNSLHEHLFELVWALVSHPGWILPTILLNEHNMLIVLMRTKQQLPCEKFCHNAAK